jgi:putative ABC transport system ATP-binding protein
LHPVNNAIIKRQAQKNAAGEFAIATLDSSKQDMDSKPVIDVRALTRSLRSGSHTVEILRGITFSVPSRQFAVIMGASGSGKSTLLGLLAGLDTPSSGEIIIDGEPIQALSEDALSRIRAVKLGFVFQSYQLVPTLTALENVLLPHELHASGDGRPRAQSLLQQVGLADRIDHYPVQLSGGEQQRVALARAFMLRPPVILADEPTGNLDSATGARVLDLLLELNRSEGATLVLVTHDPGLAQMAERKIVLHDGRILSDELRSQPSHGGSA